jgi:hypothetical protein
MMAGHHLMATHRRGTCHSMDMWIPYIIYNVTQGEPGVSVLRKHSAHPAGGAGCVTSYSKLSQPSALP